MQDSERVALLLARHPTRCVPHLQVRIKACISVPINLSGLFSDTCASLSALLAGSKGRRMFADPGVVVAGTVVDGAVVAVADAVPAAALRLTAGLGQLRLG